MYLKKASTQKMYSIYLRIYNEVAIRCVFCIVNWRKNGKTSRIKKWGKGKKNKIGLKKMAEKKKIAMNLLKKKILRV